MKLLVAYYSRSGNTKAMAQAVADGVKKENVTVELRDMKDVTADCLLEFEGFVFGSPTYYGAMAGELKRLFDESVKIHGKLSDRIGGAFASAGMMGGGGETTILSIIQAMLIHGMIIVGDARLQHYGPLSIGKPDGNDIDTCTKYGRKVAQLAKKLFK
ncbi:NAD(P)H-dependent oxidoreductase [candidate division WOR-3 bacterium]|nr:NAD(P)H-dependent oxidoreductase [candidate division WOR-3 bacterium]